MEHEVGVIYNKEGLINIEDMTQAQIDTYCNEHFQGKRASIRNQIKAVFEMTNGSFTIRELAKEMNCTYKYIQPRLSECLSSGYLYESGSKIENGVNNSVFSINRNLGLFDRKKLSKFQMLELAVKKCCHNEMSEAIMDEYKRMKK